MSIAITKILKIVRLIVAGLLLMGPISGCKQNPVTSSPVAPSEKQTSGLGAVEADYIDACSCKPACPCLYGSPPTEHDCQGATLVDIKR